MNISSRPWLATLGFGLIWLIAIIVSDATTTFHLAPVIVGASAGVVATDRHLWWAMAGTSVAAAVSIALASAGQMLGPSVLPIGGALFESLVGSALGGVIGLVAASSASAAPTPT